VVNSDRRPFGGQFLQLGRQLLEDISAGRPVRRRDAVVLARAVLESQAVRAAEAVLEADDRELLPRLVELLEATIDVNTDAGHLDATKRMP
jgi:hypothetical protein